MVQLTDLKEQNAAHYNGIVSTETKPELLIRCCYFYSISNWVGLSQCWTRSPVWRKAVPGSARLTWTRGSNSEKDSFLLFLCIR